MALLAWTRPGGSLLSPWLKISQNHGNHHMVRFQLCREVWREHAFQPVPTDGAGSSWLTETERTMLLETGHGLHLWKGLMSLWIFLRYLNSFRNQGTKVLFRYTSICAPYGKKKILSYSLNEKLPKIRRWRKDSVNSQCQPKNVTFHELSIFYSTLSSYLPIWSGRE